MTFKEHAINMVMKKISEASIKIRSIEEECRKFSVAPEANGVYISLVGYRKALQETLEDLRSIDDRTPANY